MLVSPARTARLLIALALLNLGVVTAAVAVGSPQGMRTGDPSSGDGLAAPARRTADPPDPALASPTVIPLPTRPPATPGTTTGPGATRQPTATGPATPSPRRTPAPQTDTEP